MQNLDALEKLFTHSDLIAYLAPEGFIDELKGELDFQKISVIHQFERLFVCKKTQEKIFWAQNTWLNPKLIKIDSISDASKKLKNAGKLWAPYSFTLHRRSNLIQNQLNNLRKEPYKFLEKIPQGPLGSWTLIDENHLLASSECSSSLPNGEFSFFEDKNTPPSRAYLKLWELFTLYKIMPNKGQTVIDLGSCPGGWTWVLQSIGSKVISVDKAPLDEKIQKLSNIRYLKHDAFTLKPEAIGKIDWLFSDIICYPEKLHELILLWRESGLVSNFVCTIKFKGETDYETTKKFAEIPGSRVIHLSHNKHELTWVNTSYDF